MNNKGSGDLGKKKINLDAYKKKVSEGMKYR